MKAIATYASSGALSPEARRSPVNGQQSEESHDKDASFASAFAVWQKQASSDKNSREQESTVASERLPNTPGRSGDSEPQNVAGSSSEGASERDVKTFPVDLIEKEVDASSSGFETPQRVDKYEPDLDEHSVTLTSKISSSTQPGLNSARQAAIEGDFLRHRIAAQRTPSENLPLVLEDSSGSAVITKLKLSESEVIDTKPVDGKTPQTINQLGDVSEDSMPRQANPLQRSSKTGAEGLNESASKSIDSQSRSASVGAIGERSQNFRQERSESPRSSEGETSTTRTTVQSFVNEGELPTDPATFSRKSGQISTQVVAPAGGSLPLIEDPWNDSNAQAGNNEFDKNPKSVDTTIEKLAHSRISSVPFVLSGSGQFSWNSRSIPSLDLTGAETNSLILGKEQSADLLAASEIRGASFSGSSAPQQLSASPFRAVHAPIFVQQISESAVRMPSGAVEISLSPEELGIVRMHMISSEAGLVVNLQAERPETLDLLKRNIDLLARNLADLGQDGAEFTFGDQSSRPQRHAGRDDPDLLPGEADAQLETKSPTTQSVRGLDIRL